MRVFVPAIILLVAAAPALAGHASGDAPGIAAMDGADRHGDGRTNGEDYAPGKSAQEPDPTSIDRNEDGRKNGKDYAPGQIRNGN
ncbi:hypothetical protein GE300_00030 [Rhodobacteraceae bacterium 2CG4]|uniref:Uncharacterized protein n=1 Tax=Halovulum marinum TaxID=2662447 RepID=A0A6L5YVX6_9RHOB|nr:hypothetical protein [Halovulum marinum]MSU88002.1 hypothetical protein [Halovulum marinum]